MRGTARSKWKPRLHDSSAPVSELLSGFDHERLALVRPFFEPGPIMSVFRREYIKAGKSQQRWAFRRVIRLPNGTRKCLSGTPAVNTKLAAEALERQEIEKALHPERFGPERQAPAFGDFAAEYVQARSSDWKLSERLTNKSILDNHLLPKLKDERIDQIRGAQIEDLKTHLRQRLGDKSIYNVLTLLRRILRYAQFTEVLDSVPMFAMPKKVRLARKERAAMGIGREMFLSFQELEQLIEHVSSPMLRAMVLVAARTGLRAGEVRALQWGDIDYRRNEITVLRAESRGVIDKPKSGAGRRVPLPSRLKAALSELPRSIAPDALCFTDDGRIFSEGRMTSDLMAAACAAGIKTAQDKRQRKNDHQRGYRLRRLQRELTKEEVVFLAQLEASKSHRFGWHTLRHTFCTHLAMSGTPIVKIQDWAGHADIATTQGYMHWADSKGDAYLIDMLDAPDARVLALVGE